MDVGLAHKLTQVYKPSSKGIIPLSEQSKMLAEQYGIPKEALNRAVSKDYNANLYLQTAQDMPLSEIDNLLNHPNTAHFSDIGKLPNHMTFSNESAYSTPKQQGGEWVSNGNNWTFYASPYNMTQHSPEELKQYFNKYEQGNRVVMPEGLASKVGRGQ